MPGAVKLLIGASTLSLGVFYWSSIASHPLEKDWTGCIDEDADCEGPVAAGKCKSEREAMKTRCARSCGFCEHHHVTCTDSNRDCPAWARLGQCEKNPGFMVKSCQRSCGTCVSCLRVAAPALSLDTRLHTGALIQAGRPVYENAAFRLEKDTDTQHWVLVHAANGSAVIKAGRLLGEPYADTLFGTWRRFVHAPPTRRRDSTAEAASDETGWVTDRTIDVGECPDDATPVLAKPSAAPVLDAKGGRAQRRLPEEMVEYAKNHRHDKPVKGQHFDADYDVFNPKPKPRSYEYPKSGPPAFLYPEDLPDAPDIPFFILSHEPRTYYFPKFMSDKEADDIRKAASRKLTRSSVVPTKGRQTSGIDDVRTSSGCWLDNRVPSVEEVRLRVLDITGFQKNQTEMLQVLKYEIGQKYISHLDYFTPHGARTKAEEDELWALKWNNNWNRAATFFLYLETTEAGGATVLPRANGGPTVYNMSDCTRGLRVYPTKGAAVLFYDMKPDKTQDPFSLHGGCPVIKGEKWAAPQWLHVKVRDKGASTSFW
ncbi:Prolyl 4-hydroxylase 2 [Diplonema papillatum]|nr:Prolyl 4-hydroxylase 2 [Diplonema papillatum]